MPPTSRTPQPFATHSTVSRWRSTSSIRSERPITRQSIAGPPRPSLAKPSAPASPNSSTSAAWATTGPISRRTSGAGSRRLRHSSSGAVPVTTLRAAVVIGRGSAAFETIVSLVDRLPAMIAPRWVTTPTQPIALADVVRYLVGVTRLPDALGSELRRRRARGSHLQGDDRANRIRPWQAAPHRRGPGVEPAALLLLAPPRHPGEGSCRASAHRRAPQPDGRTRRSSARSASVPAHLLRRRSPRGSLERLCRPG